MASTMTVDDLAKQVLDEVVLKAFDRVELEMYDDPASEDTITIDDMMEQYLSPGAVEAFSEVELNDECAGWDIIVKQLRIGSMRLGYARWQCAIQGKSLLVIVLTIASLLMGVNAVVSLLQALSGLL